MLCWQGGVPALFGVLVPLVVELQGDLGIQPDPKVVVHHAFLSAESEETEAEGRTWENTREREEEHDPSSSII